MPNSLVDMMFQPQNAAGEPASLGDAFTSRSNSLIGLGLGMLQPSRPLQGESTWGNALQGFQAGAGLDQRQAAQAAQIRHQKAQEGLQRQQLAQGMLTSDIKEFQYAKKGGYTGSFQDWQKQQQQLQEKYSMSPSYYYDADGKLQMGQLGSRGGMRPTGVTPSETQMKIDTGTGTQLGGTRTGLPPSAPVAAPVAPVPGSAPDATLTTPAPMSQTTPPGFFSKDLRTKAQETELGKDTAKAIQALPAIESNTTRALERIGALKTHPGLDQVTGFIMGKLPTAATPNGRDALARIDEIQNATWMNAIQDLRGMGALSNREGERADAARSRLRTRDVSSTDYRKAISDLEDVLKAGRDNARAIASGKMKPYAGEQPTDGGNKPRLKFNPATGDFE